MAPRAILPLRSGHVAWSSEWMPVSPVSNDCSPTNSLSCWVPVWSRCWIHGWLTRRYDQWPGLLAFCNIQYMLHLPNHFMFASPVIIDDLHGGHWPTSFVCWQWEKKCNGVFVCLCRSRSIKTLDSVVCDMNMYPAGKSTHHDLHHWYQFPKTPSTLHHQTPLAPPVTSAAARAGIWPDTIAAQSWSSAMGPPFCSRWSMGDGLLYWTVISYLSWPAWNRSCSSWVLTPLQLHTSLWKADSSLIEAPWWGLGALRTASCWW